MGDEWTNQARFVGRTFYCYYYVALIVTITSIIDIVIMITKRIQIEMGTQGMDEGTCKMNPEMEGRKKGELGLKYE